MFQCIFCSRVDMWAIHFALYVFSVLALMIFPPSNIHDFLIRNSYLFLWKACLYRLLSHPMMNALLYLEPGCRHIKNPLTWTLTFCPMCFCWRICCVFLPFLPADMEDLDVSLGQNAMAYHHEVLSSSMPGKFLQFPVLFMNSELAC